MNKNVELIENLLVELDNYHWDKERVEDKRRKFENILTKGDIIIPFKDYVRLESRDGHKIWADNRVELLMNKEKYIGKMVKFSWIDKYDTDYLYADIVD